MQMQEIALLRSKIEKHLLNHLEINWRIEQLNLNGQVPVGSLLSSVSFLRQMALPTLTIALQIDNQTSPKTSTTTNNDFNVVQVGEIVCVSVSIYFSIGGTLTGELSLGCYQNFQNTTNTNNTSIEHPDKFFIFGPNCLPIEIEGIKKQREEEEGKEIVEGEGREGEGGGYFSTKICFAFCFEGIYKIFPKFERIQIFDEAEKTNYEESLYTLNNEQDIFMTALSFSVINK
uniref:Uncharacterized protein n=1 Tax=Meloidogyne enterolobii TaxID=390850 RepID=A0A6V7TJH1_MELEN|nr:unnamed protein product [Meloidogyne enterolobii]